MWFIQISILQHFHSNLSLLVHHTCTHLSYAHPTPIFAFECLFSILLSFVVSSMRKDPLSFVDKREVGQLYGCIECVSVCVLFLCSSVRWLTMALTVILLSFGANELCWYTSDWNPTVFVYYAYVLSKKKLLVDSSGSSFH